MDYQDRSVQCIDCHQAFSFTAGEQEFYERKGFKEVPKRCKPCRDKKKSKRDGAGSDDGVRGGGPVRGGGSGGSFERNGHGSGKRDGGGAGQPKQLFDTTCVVCGAATRVPFRPVESRPVYCRDCFANRLTGS